MSTYLSSGPAHQEAEDVLSNPDWASWAGKGSGRGRGVGFRTPRCRRACTGLPEEAVRLPGHTVGLRVRLGFLFRCSTGSSSSLRFRTAISGFVLTAT